MPSFQPTTLLCLPVLNTETVSLARVLIDDLDGPELYAIHKSPGEVVLRFRTAKPLAQEQQP